MKNRTLTLGAVMAAALSFAVYVGWHLFRTPAQPEPSPTAVGPANLELSSIAKGEEATRRHIKDGLKAGDTDPANGQRILYYQDPMVPGKRFETPAKSPFMDMMLVPVYTGADSQDGSSVTVSPRVQQNLGLRTAVVEKGTLSPQLQAVGSVAWNERDQSVIQARATGYIEKLHVRATLDPVRAGQPFADLFVPDWLAAQQEYLSIRKAAPADGALVAAARQRMLLAGMTQSQMDQVDAAGIPQPRITISVPSSGVVAELVAREGMTVTPGMSLARINGLATVWAVAEVPESQIALLRPGARVEARSPGVPGMVFNGAVQAILPEVTPVTRTLKARIQLANPGAVLSPGMLVTMQFIDMRATPAFLVPTEAIIATGQRTVVMVAEDGGRYRPVNVEIGIETNGQTEVKSGLTAGQRVVVSSQFLIDSEASLKGVEARLNHDVSAPAVKHHGVGKVEAIGKDSVTLSHGPVVSAGWKAMTMEFKAPVQGVPRNVEVGDQVEFEFLQPKDDVPTLTRIYPLVLAPPTAVTSGATGASR